MQVKGQDNKEKWVKGHLKGSHEREPKERSRCVRTLSGIEGQLGWGVLEAIVV